VIRHVERRKSRQRILHFPKRLRKYRLFLRHSALNRVRDTGAGVGVPLLQRI
jgi:hypothetical protein